MWILIYSFNNDNSDEEMDELYEVDKIISHKGVGKSIQYLVKWKGYKETTCKDTNNFNSDSCIKEYWDRR